MENEEKVVPQTEETVTEEVTENTAETQTNDTDEVLTRLRAENEALKKSAEETNDKYLRTLAEYDNYRKRTTKEKRDSYSNGVTKAVMDLIPVIDTLEMALAAPCTDDNFKKGIEMTVKKAEAVLTGLNVSEIEALGKEFDPNLHARVMQEEKEGVEAGIVTKVFQKGYRLGDKVIRHSTVVVSC